MRSLFFLPECDYWVHNSNFLPVVLDNLIFFFVFYDSLRCKFTSYDQTSTVFDSRFSKVKLCFPSDLDQHKFSLEKIEDVLFILKKKKIYEGVFEYMTSETVTVLWIEIESREKKKIIFQNQKWW